MNEELAQANRYRLEERYVSAISKYQEILKIDDLEQPYKIEAYLGLAHCLSLFGNFDEALVQYSTLLSIPNLGASLTAQVMVKSSETLNQLGMHDEAADRLESAIAYYKQIAEQEYKDLNYGMSDYYYQVLISILPPNHDDIGLIILNHSNVELQMIRDLSLSANMYRYNRDPEKAKVFGWKSLMMAIELISKLVEHELEYIPAINQIKEHFPYARHSLLSEVDEFTEVIKLKLHELESFFEEMTDEIPDDPEDVQRWVETQSVSIRYMVPKTPPAFMLLTPDGRFISYIEATQDLRVQNNPINHLIVSLLTAAREMFLQTDFTGAGLIHEIDMGEHSLILRGSEYLIVVAIVTIPLDELRDFTSKLASSLEVEFASILKSWLGDSESVEPLLKRAKAMIKEDIVEKY